MSRIKDLYAEVEDIDDLKPVTRYTKEFADTIREIDNERIAKGVTRLATKMSTEDFIADNAIFGLGDDDGHPCMFMENFTQLCDQIAIDNLDTMIEQEHLDLTDEEYADIIDKASAQIADYYADYESALCADEFTDYNQDKKYSILEERERHGQC